MTGRRGSPRILSHDAAIPANVPATVVPSPFLPSKRPVVAIGWTFPGLAEWLPTAWADALRGGVPCSMNGAGFLPSWNTRCSIMNADPPERRSRTTQSRCPAPCSPAFQGKERGSNAERGARMQSRRVAARCRRRPSLSGRILARAVRLYQLVLSPIVPPHCRHLPTCSEYAIEALREHGAVRGGWLAIRRITRCHPFGTSGFDPVPAHGGSHRGRALP